MPIPLTAKLSSDSTELEVTTVQRIPKEHILKQKAMLQSQMDRLQAQMDKVDGQLSLFPEDVIIEKTETTEIAI